MKGVGMAAERRVLVIGLTVAFAVTGGAAWAVAQGGNSEKIGFAPATEQLVRGKAPSGHEYTISRIDPSDVGEDAEGAFCTEVRTSVAAAQHCSRPADEKGQIDGQPLRPSFSLLGTDRFFSILAPKGVTSMEVTVEGDATSPATSEAIDAGPAGKLLVTKVGGPMVTSRDPSSSRDYDVRLLDASGETVLLMSVSDPQ